MIIEKMKLVLSDSAATLGRIAAGRRLSQTFSQSQLAELLVEGILIVPDYFERDRALAIGATVESYILQHPELCWVDAARSDYRLMGAEMYIDDVKFFHNNPTFDALNKYATGRMPKCQHVLANIVMFRESNKGSGGGWHRDSPFSKQFKTFLYLTDVGLDNGPLTYIPRSHQGKVIRTMHSAKEIPLSQYRFTDELVADCVSEGLVSPPISAVGAAGTLIVADVRGMHRGLPIRDGKRVALTNYYFNSIAQPEVLVADYPSLRLKYDKSNGSVSYESNAK